MKAGITGVASLEAMIAQVRDLGRGPEYAQAAARSVDEWLRAQLAAGVDPNTGSAWEQTKKGERPLKSAATRPEVRLAGTSIVISLRGYYVFQHFPTRGRMARRVIPLGRMPAELGNAIRRGMVEPFEAKSKGGKRGWRATHASKAKGAS